MTVSNRHFRRIVVDGIAYRWKFSRVTADVADGWSYVLVQRVEPAGAFLRVGFLGRWHLSGPCREHSRPILPSDVASAVRAALAAGWQADKPGKMNLYWVPQADAGPGAAPESSGM
jgi:hypothetical protein